MAESQQQFPEIMRGYRRVPLQRFPYGIDFSIGENHEVCVRAILHLHRDPARWQDRLSGGVG